MNAYEIMEHIRKGKNLPDEKWFVIRDEIIKLLKSDALEEEKKLFHPFGYMEMVSMICNGIEHNKHSAE